MLIQYIIDTDNSAEIEQQMSAAIEAGVQWIEIKAADTVSDADITAIVEKFRSKLAEDNVVVVLAARYELVKELQVDGVHVYNRAVPLSKIRLALDAWPMLGVSVENSEDVTALRGFDIDYIFLSPTFTADGNRLDDVKSIAALLDADTIEAPLVCGGGITFDNARDAINVGAGSLAIDASIAEGGDLKEAIARFIKEYDTPVPAGEEPA